MVQNYKIHETFHAITERSYHVVSIPNTGNVKQYCYFSSFLTKVMFAKIYEINIANAKNNPLDYVAIISDNNIIVQS